MNRQHILPALLLAFTSCAPPADNAPEPAETQAAAPAESRVAAPGDAAITPALIPEAFVGEWNASVRDCGTGSSDMRLRIDPARLRFHESQGAVVSVIRHDSRSVSVSARYVGEGQAWDRSDRLTLSKTGDTLTVQTGQTGQDRVVRHRCPAKRVPS